MEITHVGAGATHQTNGTFNLAYPTGLQAGDLLVAVCYMFDDDATNPSCPSGWTQAYDLMPNSAERVEVFWKRATGTESGTQEFTRSYDGTDYAMGVMCAFRNVISEGDPFDPQYTYSKASSATASWSSFTPDNDNTLIVAIGTHDYASGGFGAMTGYTECYDRSASEGGKLMLSVQNSQQTTREASGSATSSLTTSIKTWSALHCALRSEPDALALNAIMWGASF